VATRMQPRERGFCDIHRRAAPTLSRLHRAGPSLVSSRSTSSRFMAGSWKWKPNLPDRPIC